jgi:metal-sulfur cluster biosynthetic enzyme
MRFMTEAGVREALRDVVDPELGINIVDLGLIYDIRIDDATVHVTMTMTSPACPLRDYIRDLVESTVTSHVPDAERVAVEIVDEPPWTDAMMSDAARQQLG